MSGLVIRKLEDLIPALNWLPETAIVAQIDYAMFTDEQNYWELEVLFTWNGMERCVPIICEPAISYEIHRTIKVSHSVREILDAIYSVTRPTVEIQFEA